MNKTPLAVNGWLDSRGTASMRGLLRGSGAGPLEPAREPAAGEAAPSHRRGVGITRRGSMLRAPHPPSFWQLAPPLVVNNPSSFKGCSLHF